MKTTPVSTKCLIISFILLLFGVGCAGASAFEIFTSETISKSLLPVLVASPVLILFSYATLLVGLLKKGF